MDLGRTPDDSKWTKPAGPSSLRRTLHAFVPSHFHDPVGLLRRLLTADHDAARYAIGYAFMGALAAPADKWLERKELRRYEKASAPRLPLLFICGPPRSGTTLVAQVLARTLPVATFTNLTSIFPRSPIEATLRLGSYLGRPCSSLSSYYGKTVGLNSQNDGLYLWDRWLGADRTQVRTQIDPVQRLAMQRFFGALEQTTGCPLLAKNNALNTCADLISPILPTAHFICLSRDPLYLAQALYRARRDIHGDIHVAYGVRPPGLAPSDPIKDIVRQIRYLERCANYQKDRLGPRFRVWRYEEFCANPSSFVRDVAQEVLGHYGEESGKTLPKLTASTQLTLPRELVKQIQKELEVISSKVATGSLNDFES